MEFEIRQSMHNNLLYIFKMFENNFETNEFREGITMLPHQAFISKLFIQSDYMKSLLLFWDTGMGKTLTIVYMIYILLNKKLNWKIALFIKKQLKVDPWENNIFKYIPDLADYIDFFFYDSINSYGAFNKFIKLNSNNNILIIVDEAHNLISRSTNKENAEEKKTTKLFNLIKKAAQKDNNKIVLLTATPIINSYEELNTLSNLLKKNPLVINREDLNRNNIINLQSYFNLTISYQFFSENDLFKSQIGTKTLPSKNVIEANLKVSPRQEQLIKEALKKDISNNMMGLMTYSKIYSTFALDRFPENNENLKLLSTKVVDILKKYKEKMSPPFKVTVEPSTEEDKKIYKTLYEYSSKFMYAVKKIKDESGKSIVYINLVKSGGIMLFKIYLELFGISYIEYSSVSIGERDENLAKFNNIENKDGDIVKVCIFSNAGNEGINFNCINNLFLIDITWTIASIRQIFGRSIRFRSHDWIDRKYVNIHILKSILSDGSSIENRLMQTIEKKSNDLSVLTNIFKNSSFETNFNINDYLDNNFIDEVPSEENELMIEIYNSKFNHDKKSMIASKFKDLTPIMIEDSSGKIIEAYRDDLDVYINSRLYGKIKTDKNNRMVFYIRDNSIIFILEDLESFKKTE